MTFPIDLASRPEQPSYGKRPFIQPHAASLDGLPCFWLESSQAYTAALVFRVGRADETLATSGITHLVEHLALSTIGEQRYQFNAFVDHHRTSFYAVGEPYEIGHFFAHVTRALRELPLDRLAHESQVLRVEEVQRDGDLTTDLLYARYGAVAYGLLANRELGLGTIGADQVQRWAHERFTRENAAVWFRGTPADNVSFDLPQGGRIPPPVPEPIDRLVLPASVSQGDWPGAALSFEVPRRSSMAMVLRIAAKRAHRVLRDEGGHSYTVGANYLPLTATVAHAAIMAPSLREDVDRVSEGLLEIVDDLAQRGPTEEEIAGEIDAFERTMTLEEGQAAALDRDAMEELLGAPPRSASDIYREYLDVTPPRAALAMNSVLGSMLLRLPADHAPDPRLQLYPGPLPPVTGKVFRAPGATKAAFMGAVRRQEDVDAKRRLVVGEAGVSLVIEADLYATIRYERCVALVRWPQGSRTLVERDGSALVVDPLVWEDGAEAVRMIDSRFPPAMTVEGFVKGGG